MAVIEREGEGTYVPKAPSCVLLNDQLLGRCDQPQSCSIGPFSLRAGSNTITLASSRPPERIESDPRLLGTALWTIHLAAADEPSTARQ